MSAHSSIRIAICIPAYQAVRTLPRLFASIHAQTVAFDEVWLYDDASADSTADMAAGFGANVVRGLKNVGCSGGKNALLARIESDWVHFHDADDTLHPEFVERAKKRIAESAFDVLLFDYEQIDEHTGQRISRSDFSNSRILENPIRYLLRETVNNGGVYSTALLRKVGGFDDDLAVQFNEDRAFHLRLAEQGARFAVEPYIGCRFFYNANSMSANNQSRCSKANQEITMRYAARHPGENRQEVIDQSWHNAGVLASYLDWQAADVCVDFAIQQNGRIPGDAGKLFTALCYINGKWAIRIREKLIRLLKPQYRPSASSATRSQI